MSDLTIPAVKESTPDTFVNDVFAFFDNDPRTDPDNAIFYKLLEEREKNLSDQFNFNIAINYLGYSVEEAPTYEDIIQIYKWAEVFFIRFNFSDPLIVDLEGEVSPFGSPWLYHAKSAGEYTAAALCRFLETDERTIDVVNPELVTEYINNLLKAGIKPEEILEAKEYIACENEEVVALINSLCVLH